MFGLELESTSDQGLEIYECGRGEGTKRQGAHWSLFWGEPQKPVMSFEVLGLAIMAQCIAN